MYMYLQHMAIVLMGLWFMQTSLRKLEHTCTCIWYYMYMYNSRLVRGRVSIIVLQYSTIYDLIIKFFVLTHSFVIHMILNLQVHVYRHWSNLRHYFLLNRISSLPKE